MSEWHIILLMGCVLFSTFTVEGISGFGSTVLALPFIALFTGIEYAVPLLSALSLLITTFIISRSWKHIDLREYAFIILHVAAAVPVGMMLMDHLPREILLSILVIFMLCVGVNGLRSSLKTPASPPAAAGTAIKTLPMRLVLFCGGIIQGAFSSGGPLIIIYSSKALPQKSLFRVTMSMVWLTTNTIMQIKWIISGDIWDTQLLKRLLSAIPFVIAGMLFGDFLHNKVNEKRFRVIVYLILVISSLILGANTLLTSLRS